MQASEVSSAQKKWKNGFLLVDRPGLAELSVWTMPDVSGGTTEADAE